MTALQRFLAFCPGGFGDPGYLKRERDAKWEAHELWKELLNEQAFEDLLERDEVVEIGRRAMRVEGKTKLMLSRFEKAALHDALTSAKSAKLFANGLFDLIYGEDEFQVRLTEFFKDLGSMREVQTSLLKWPVATIFPYLAMPSKHMFLKPEVTKQAAERQNFSLNYKPQLNWLTYSRCLDLANVIWEEVSDLNPRDMIDIQSYIWVTEGWKRKLPETT
jgi:hypothetical protein